MNKLASYLALIATFAPNGLDFMFTEDPKFKGEVDAARIKEFTLQFLYAHPDTAIEIYNNKREFIENIPEHIRKDASMYNCMEGVVAALKIFKKERR